jgi:hypothetical protein
MLVELTPLGVVLVTMAAAAVAVLVVLVVTPLVLLELLVDQEYRHHLFLEIHQIPLEILLLPGR